MTSDRSTTPAGWLWERMTAHLERPALESDRGVRTYRQLLEGAERVAVRLRHEIGPGRAALMLAPRAVPDTVVLLLGLWCAGLTAVLADVRTPDARVDEMLGALPPAAILRAGEPGEPGEAAGADVLETGGLSWRLERRERPGGFPYGCPDPAYVITTSGSTGTPKLVLCRHSGLHHLADAWNEWSGYEPGSRVLQFAPASYDAMISELVVPLAMGSTLVFGAFGEPPSPARICEQIAAAGVTHVTLPPTVLRHLADLGAPGCTIVSAGEALDGALARALLKRCGRLINAYGPCEATVAATAFEVTEAGVDTVPIGTPLRGVKVELDPLPESRPDVPAGAGTISIAGPTVAWGYVTGDRLADASTPGFSADGRFVTGDIAWRADDGQLVFGGRIDRQIKRWGHRVEPGAIERRLRRIPGVSDCAVVAETGRLHAFVVSSTPADALAAAARQLLPRHEQPSDWHLVDHLPALMSDKMDSAALTGAVATEPATVAPLDPRLVELWERFVGAADGPGTDVFAAGGDSMGSMLLLSAVAEELGVSVDIVDFLSEPTLGALDARVASVG